MFTVNALNLRNGAYLLRLIASADTRSVAEFSALALHQRLGRSIVVLGHSHGQVVSMHMVGRAAVGRIRHAEGMLPVWLEPELSLAGTWNMRHVMYPSPNERVLLSADTPMERFTRSTGSLT